MRGRGELDLGPGSSGKTAPCVRTHAQRAIEASYLFAKGVSLHRGQLGGGQVGRRKHARRLCSQRGECRQRSPPKANAIQNITQGSVGELARHLPFLFKLLIHSRRHPPWSHTHTQRGYPERPPSPLLTTTPAPLRTNRYQPGKRKPWIRKSRRRRK